MKCKVCDCKCSDARLFITGIYKYANATESAHDLRIKATVCINCAIDIMNRVAHFWDQDIGLKKER